MGNTRRRQAGGWVGWAAPALCKPSARTMWLREAADENQVAGGLSVPEVYFGSIRTVQSHLFKTT